MRGPRLRLAIILSGWVALVSPGAVRAGFAGTEVFLPSVGRVTGFGGSEFYTTVWITNLSSTATVNFQFQFLRTGQANTAPLSFSDTLAPGQTRIFENIVETRFGLTGANGAARIVATGDVFVSSRIFEQPPGTDLGSSKGLFFSGVPGTFGLSAGERASLQGVNQGGTQNLRYNFILLEIGGQPTTLHVDLKDGNGTTLAGKDYALQAYEHRQLNVADILPGIATTNARLEAQVTSGSGKALFAGAQVTNVSQDPTGFEMSFKGSLLNTDGGTDGNAGVLSLNGLTGAVTLAAGTNVTISRSGNTLTIASAGAGGLSSGWSLNGNAGTVAGGHFLGTTDNTALELKVNSQRAFRLEPNPDSPNVIGGSAANAVTPGVFGAAIGGGGFVGNGNRVTGTYGTVGGGYHNTAGGDVPVPNDDNESATVAGGRNNSATDDWSTVGGGDNNLADGGASVVAGGGGNKATGAFSVVSGGQANTASGGGATVPGGGRNVALGIGSFAAGQRAKANHNGAFVWADGIPFDLESSVANQFLVRATGGAVFVRGPNPPTGLTSALAAQTGSPDEEAGWFYTASPVSTAPVLKLLHVPGATNNFLECFDFQGITSVSRCAITSAGTFIGDGSGLSNVWKLNGNAISAGQFLGTTNGQPLELKVNGQRALRLEFSTGSPNVIGGSSGNFVASGITGATIGGGGLAGGADANRVLNVYGTVSGGTGNVTGAEHGVVGGGFRNNAAGVQAVVSGGALNTAGGQNATVGGGTGNEASGFLSVVGGGEFNTASGRSATVAGGSNNVALGDFSFAGGRRAKAVQSGAFVWGDSTDADVASAAPNQFVVRAAGGTKFFSNAALSAGVLLAPGAGAWSSLSDREVKENIQPVDGRDALERLSRVSIGSWNYKSQDASIRHMGPMAQDFRAAFGLGEDEKHISTVDADGVALAAIQALYDIVREKDREIQTLRERLDALEDKAD